MSATGQGVRQTGPSGSGAARTAANWRGTTVVILRDYAVIVTGVIVFVFLSASQSAFFSVTNLENIAYQNAPLTIMAVGTTIAIIMRGFDLSMGSVYAFAGVTAAWLANHVDPTVGIIGGVVTGLLVGVVNGLLVTKGRINSFLATLATGIIVVALGNLITGGFQITVTNPSFQTIGTSQVLGLQDATWLLVIFAVVVGVILAMSRFGRYSYAIGGNPAAARLSGVRLNFVQVAAFGLSGLGAGAAGVIAASEIGQGSTDVGSDLTLQAIAAVVVGGTSIAGGSGAIWRSVCGVALLAMIANGISLFGANPVYGDIITGLIILVAVALQGLTKRG
jgi:ribose transport system permease protein